MDKLTSQVANIMKHGERVKSVKASDGKKKLKVKFHEGSSHEKALRAHEAIHGTGTNKKVEGGHHLR